MFSLSLSFSTFCDNTRTVVSDNGRASSPRGARGAAGEWESTSAMYVATRRLVKYFTHFTVVGVQSQCAAACPWFKIISNST